MNTIRMWLENWYVFIHIRMKNYSEKVTSSLEVGKPKNHLLVLDGVRAIACLAVLSYHANFLARNYGIWNPLKSNVWNPLKDSNAALIYFGESGVILFFLLSGFLLFLPFAKVLLFDGKWPSVRRFYLRRFFRIIPGYFVALFLIILFFHPEFFHAVHRSQLFEFLTFRMSNDLSQQVNGPFWTLAIEFQFYMLLPILAWLFSMIVRRGALSWRVVKLTGCLLVMLAWGLFSRYWGLLTTGVPAQNSLQSFFLILKPYVYGDTGKYFEVFAVGMLIAMVYVYTQNVPNREIWLKRFERWSAWVLLVGLVILGFLSLLHLYYINIDPYDYHKYDPVFSFMDPHTKLFSQIWLQWGPIAYAISYGLGMYALLYGSKRLKWLFELPVLRWVGLISFSLYMWHLPFIFLYVNVILPQFHGWGGMVKYIGLLAWIMFVIIPITLTLYRWIEMPGMRLGEALIQRTAKGKKNAPPADVPSNTRPEGATTDSLVEVPS